MFLKILLCEIPDVFCGEIYVFIWLGIMLFLSWVSFSFFYIEMYLLIPISFEK